MLFHSELFQVGLPHALIGVEDDTDGKEIVDTFEPTFLFLHLLPDAMDTLRTTFHVEMQTGLFQLLIDRADKLLYIGITTLFGSIQLFLDHIVSIVLQIFQGEILQLTLQLIQTQFVGKRCIEVIGLLTHLYLCLFLFGIPDLPHQVYTIGNHNEDHTHVLGKGEQQIPEILALYDRILSVQLLNAYQTMKDRAYRFSIILFDLLKGFQTMEYT